MHTFPLATRENPPSRSFRRSLLVNQPFRQQPADTFPLPLPSSPRLSRLKVEREKEVAEGLTKFDLRRMSRVVDAGSIFSAISIFLLRFLCYGAKGVGGGFVRFAKIPRVFRDRVLEGEGKEWLVNSSDASWMHPVA